MSDLSPYLPGFIAAYSVLMVAALSPGPAVALLLGIGLGQGRRSALIATSGIACGSVVLNALTMAGVGLIVSQAAWAMGALRLLGAAYLLWLAWGAFRKAATSNVIAPASAPRASAGRYFAMGFLLQATNPKAIAFWLAIASIGATHGGDAGVIALFFAGAFVISFACHAFWAIVLSSRPVRTTYTRIRRPIEAALGGFFVFAASRLATDRG